MKTKYREALNEVSQILSLMREEDRKKINENFLNFIEKNKSTFNEIDIVPNIDLEKQGISDETKAIIYIIYNKYFKE